MSPNLGIFASQISGHLTSPSSFYNIATLSGSGVSTVTFSSIPSTYKSLQIRMFGQANSGFGGNMKMRFNGDTATNYAQHYLTGNGSTASASGNASTNAIGLLTYDSNIYTFFSNIVDIIDYSSISKYKTARSFYGYNTNGANGQEIDLISGLWQSTTAINSITIFGDIGNFSSTTQFALYGIN